MQELEFVDDARRELVDLLERAYLRVAGTAVPEWISIEAPSGWGKSRLVHELYRRLAATHQDDGAFWPSSLAGAMAAGAEGGDPGVDAVRKRTFPEQLSPATGATPAWPWWGIGCDHRYGTPLQALANDIGQIERLTGVLESHLHRRGIWPCRFSCRPSGIRHRTSTVLSRCSDRHNRRASGVGPDGTRRCITHVMKPPVVTLRARRRRCSRSDTSTGTRCRRQVRSRT